MTTRAISEREKRRREVGRDAYREQKKSMITMRINVYMTDYYTERDIMAICKPRKEPFSIESGERISEILLKTLQLKSITKTV